MSQSQLRAVYALTEPTVPGHVCLGSSQQIDEDWRDGEVKSEHMPLYYFTPEERPKLRRVPAARRHDGRLRKVRRG